MVGCGGGRHNRSKKLDDHLLGDQPYVLVDHNVDIVVNQKTAGFRGQIVADEDRLPCKARFLERAHHPGFAKPT